MAHATQRCIPQEIVDQIIDNLFNDPHTLAQCGLTSPNWLRSVRKHRYREVRVTWASFKVFEDLLDSLPEIAAYVRCLRVDFSVQKLLNLWREFAYDLDMLFVLNRLLSKLPLVQNLHLSRAPLPEPSAIPKTITSLYLREVWVASYPKFLEWLVLLPHLRSFTFTGVHTTTPAGDVWLREGLRWHELMAISKAHPFEALEEFSVFPAGKPIDWLLVRVDPSRLRILSFCPPNAWHSPMVKNMIQGLGSALNTLEVSHFFFTDYLEQDPSLSFAQCDQLRTIRMIGYVMLYSERSQKSAMDWVPRFLSYLRAPNITAVQFVLDPRQDSHCTNLAWLEATLALVQAPHSSLQRLQRVVFQLGAHFCSMKLNASEWNTYATTQFHATSMQYPSAGLEFEVAFLGRGRDTWPVTSVRPTTVATFLSGQSTIAWSLEHELEGEART